ncbi:TPA: cell surface protein, partial [Listeria monocytogenes]
APPTPVTPVKPNNPTTIELTSKEKAVTLKVTPTQHEKTIVASKLKLPTTGDNLWDSVMYSLFGLIVVFLGFSLFFRSKKTPNK